MSVGIEISGSWDRWVKGFADLPDEMEQHGLDAWDDATAEFFDRSQQVVHVVTGELKRSGSHETEVVGDEMLGVVEYDAEHAIYEEWRGGTHAFLTRAWEATEARFASAMPEAWEQVVASWR